MITQASELGPKQVRIVYEAGAPDKDGRRTFFAIWLRKIPDGPHAGEMREFGQIFRAVPAVHIEHWRAKGYTVLEVEPR